MKLDDLRQEIDGIDIHLIELLEKRLDISQEIAEFKGKNGLSIYDKEREVQVIEKNLKRAKKKYQKYIAEFMHCLMDISKDVQKNREKE